MLDPSQGIALFTDGSAWTRDRTGGWAWVAIDINGDHLCDSGFVEDTTISQMELLGPTLGLAHLYDQYGSIEVLVLSDSQYVVLGCNDRTRKRNVNKDFWNALDTAIELHEYVEFEHVKGHAGQKWNEMADDLAGAARKSGCTT